MSIQTHKIEANIDYIGDITLLIIENNYQNDAEAMRALWDVYWKEANIDEEPESIEDYYETEFLTTNKLPISLKTLQARFSELIEMFEEYSQSKHGMLEQTPPDALATVKPFLNDTLEQHANFILQLRDDMTSFEVFIRNDTFLTILGWEHYA